MPRLLLRAVGFSPTIDEQTALANKLEETVKSSRSGTRVEAIVDRPQPRLEHVRVDLRRRQIGVAEHHLDRAQIGAAFEQMRRERMAQDVRAERAAAGRRARP